MVATGSLSVSGPGDRRRQAAERVRAPRQPVSITSTDVGKLGPVGVTSNATTLASNTIGAPGDYSYTLSYSQPTAVSDTPGTYTAILTFAAASGT